MRNAAVTSAFSYLSPELSKAMSLPVFTYQKLVMEAREQYVKSTQNKH